MSRPRVQISATNHITTLRHHLNEMLPRFIALPGVVGLTLNGGLSRGYADHLSEIDVTFYLTPDALKAWQQGKSPIALGITMLDGQLYDVKIVDYLHEQERQWDDVALWDASYAEILYDPNDILHDLYAAKLSQPPDPGQSEGLMMGCWWHFELAGEIWIHRGDGVQGHQMLNAAVMALVQALFVANREYIPHEKWLLHMSRTLAWTPAEWESRLRLVMSTGDMTVESLRVRQGLIRELWEEIDCYIREKFFPNLPVHMMQKSTYESLKLLVEQGEMSLSEWQAQTGRDFPNSDPFYPFVKLEEGRIVIDQAALGNVQPHAMYAWHDAVLQAVVNGA